MPYLIGQKGLLRENDDPTKTFCEQAADVFVQLLFITKLSLMMVQPILHLMMLRRKHNPEGDYFL